MGILADHCENCHAEMKYCMSSINGSLGHKQKRERFCGKCRDMFRKRALKAWETRRKMEA